MITTVAAPAHDLTTASRTSNSARRTRHTPQCGFPVQRPPVRERREQFGDPVVVRDHAFNDLDIEMRQDGFHARLRDRLREQDQRVHLSLLGLEDDIDRRLAGLDTGAQVGLIHRRWGCRWLQVQNAPGWRLLRPGTLLRVPDKQLCSDLPL